MEPTESQISHEFYYRLFQSLNQHPLNGLKLVTEDRWQTPILLRSFDLAVYKNNNPLMIVEIKRTLANKNQLAIGLDQVLSGLSITNARFGLVTDNERFFFYDRKFKEDYYQKVTFEFIIDIIVKSFEIKETNRGTQDLSEIFIAAMNNLLLDNTDLTDLFSTLSLDQKIVYDSNRNTYHFIEEGLGANDFENRMFIALIGKFLESRICRYTSLTATYLMLNNKSFRMNGLVGMNDKSEVNYVDAYLDGIEKPLIKQDVASVKSINSKFITSCTTFDKLDDLTLWRLYAEDGKGTCLVFDVNHKNLNSHVLLHKVKYADENGRHKELDFLKYIRDEVEKVTGFAFEFRKLNFWKHFFKPYEYSIESEVRLLMIDNSNLAKIKTDWVLTHSHSITNPIIDFQLNSSRFPIALSKVILGAKCPEQETNKVQFEELIRMKIDEIKTQKIDSNFSHITVELSKITRYR